MRQTGISILLLLLLTTSCQPDTIYDHYESTRDGSWSWTDAQEFRVDISDTLSMHSISLQVRHTVEYPLSNLHMFVHIKGPGNQILKDTVSLVLARPDGEWTGRGVGNLREISLLYRKQAQFRIPGIYVFTLEQAMRMPELPVTELGIRIERINP